MPQEWQEIVREVERCTLCASDLPAGPRPVFQVHPNARVLIVGQAPGIRVHKTGIPFNDPSGDRLRVWMGVDKDIFYNPKQVAILPMGFCYPGTGKSGDLPPRKECAPAWRDQMLALMPHVKTTLVIGQYAINWHLKMCKKKNLTETVKAWREYYPKYFVLPHPSPRNNIWLKKNPWFEEDVVPELQSAVIKSL